MYSENEIIEEIKYQRDVLRQMQGHRNEIINKLGQVQAKIKKQELKLKSLCELPAKIEQANIKFNIHKKEVEQ